VLGYELVQALGRDPFPWTNTDSSQRPFSTLGQATALAQYLSVLAVGSLALGLLVGGLKGAVRGVLIVLGGLLLVGTVLTQTRSPVTGLVAAGVVLVLLVAVVHPSRNARRAAVLAGLFAAMGLCGVLLFTPIGARFANTIETTSTAAGDDDDMVTFEPSTAARLTLYGIALQMIGERPAFGFGPDNFVVAVPRLRPDPAPAQVRQNVATSAHSWVAQVATGSGVVGLVAFVAIGLTALVVVRRAGFRPVAITALAMMAAFLGTGLTTVNEFGTEWLFWFAAGAIAATCSHHDVAATPEPARTGSGRRRATTRATQFEILSAGLCLGVSVALALTVMSALDASRSIKSSQQLRIPGRESEAIRVAEHATQADPGRAEYWHDLGLAYVAGSRFRDASAALDRAAALAPYSVRYVGDVATAQLLLLKAGDVNAKARALQLADQVVRTDPNNPLAHLTRAVVMQVTGDLPQALLAVSRAVALDPQSANHQLYVTAAQVNLDSGRAADAVRIARAGIAVLGQARNSVPVRVELARALLANGQPSEALTEIDLALVLQPNELSAARVRAQIQAALQR
jgi:cytochrome c-type biogenesis protein CcmH/NrfG